MESGIKYSNNAGKVAKVPLLSFLNALRREFECGSDATVGGVGMSEELPAASRFFAFLEARLANLIYWVGRRDVQQIVWEYFRMEIEKFTRT